MCVLYIFHDFVRKVKKQAIKTSVKKQKGDEGKGKTGESEWSGTCLASKGRCMASYRCMRYRLDQFKCMARL